MRRERRGLRPIHVLWALILAFPPLLRLVEFGGGELTSVAPPGLEGELSASEGRPWLVLQQRAERAEAQLDALGVVSDIDLYEPVLGNVLPIDDPAPTRSALYVGLRTKRRLNQEAAVVSSERWLVGRAAELIPPLPASTVEPTTGSEVAASETITSEIGGVSDGQLSVARVRTLLDPSFRVRFVSGDSRGVLRGTGQRTNDGAAAVLLVPHLLVGADHLRVGDPVVTEGDDLYPPGLRIGTVVESHPVPRLADRSDRPTSLLVRAEVRLADLRTVVLLRHRWRTSGVEAARLGVRPLNARSRGSRR